MVADQTAALRAQARAHCTALLAGPPWSEVASRALVLLARPPAVAWAEPIGIPALWMILDSSEARALPPGPRGALLTTGIHREAAPRGTFELVVFTSEAIARAFEGVPRQGLELRWSVRHAERLHDPLHRGDGLGSVAAGLPEGGLERAVRPLYVQAATALAALGRTRPDAAAEGAVVLAGEAAGAVARIACILEEGSYPPAEYLMPAARETALGRRIASWLDDLGAAVSGEPRAARWIRESGPGVLREAEAALHTEFAGRDWLVDPETYALRPGR